MSTTTAAAKVTGTSTADPGRAATDHAKPSDLREAVSVRYASEGNESLCPVRAVSAWLQHARIEHGPVFRQMRRGDTLVPLRASREGDTVVEVGLGAQSVALVVKRRAREAGLDPKVVEKLAAHSLRAGYVASAAAAGIDERKIANVTRHKNLDVLRGYIRTASSLDDVGQVL